MDFGSKEFKNVSNGVKRSFDTINSDYKPDVNATHPPKKFGFSSASKLNEASKHEPEDLSYYKHYKADERVLSSHWLFSDESPKKNLSETSSIAPLNQNSIVTTRVPSIDVVKGFKLASGKQFDGVNLQKKNHFRKLLGLDDEDFSTNERNFKLPTSRYDPFHPPKTFRSAQSTNVYEDSYMDTQSFSQSTTGAHTPRSLSYIEAWNSVCKFTKCSTSNMSPGLLSILWRQYGNPFKVEGSNAEYYKYLLYTHENDFVSLGGVREIEACFKKLLPNLTGKSDLFDEEWIMDKYRVLTLSSCRRYRKKVVKLYQKSSLEDAIANVPLPNPINVLKMLLRCARKEMSGEASIVKKIFQGEKSPDVPVVLRVQEYDRTNAYLTNGYELYTCVLADNQIRNMFDSNKISEGSKILIQGIVHKEKNGENYIILSYNAISRASNRHIGLQPKHTNVNIRDLSVTGGRVSRVEIVVLRNLPIVYKICYKCPETSERRHLLLSEREYMNMTDNMDSELLGNRLIERVSTQFTMFAVDAAFMNGSVVGDRLEWLLRRSCVHIDFVNVDDTVSYFLKPLTRLVLTNTAITHLGNDFIYRANSDAKAVKLSCTEYTKLEIVENSVKIPAEVLAGNELARILFNKLPTLSLPEDSNDLNEFNSVIYERDATVPFLGQICDLNGVIIHVGELETSQKYCFLRFFMLTSRLHLACVKVNYKNHISQNDRLSLVSEIRSVERRLKSLVVKFDYQGKGPEDEEANMFHSVNNAQYTGYDGENGIYNFQTGCEHVRIHV
ncbi:conserved hypothetical protein [Theileria orientalis strain Shintoku]|uniref:Uncharacterized protein n=1 Tax=Theileria orientalis strain Shintoku TaxID=869250 RepID=J4D679_THEOR|nr:conserved hypothetical protein [Theileria orientalis strain Shintoku]BAM39400.1 conserved hypothetical protein [Theileria orientalis strain Shintoku]|eukprot:XP_009689701.1 conserved hypothetical protein [Theileria orientalis strain Shintoku]